MKELCSILGVKIHAKDYKFVLDDKKDLKYSNFPVQAKDIVELYPKLKHIEIYNRDCRNYI